MTDDNLFQQICVWEDVPLDQQYGVDPKESLKLLERFGFRLQFKESVQVEEDRVDVFFTIHDADIERFAVRRLGIFNAATGSMYGIIFTNQEKSVEDQIDFFVKRNVALNLHEKFDTFFVFSLHLFEDTCTSEDECNEQAHKTLEKLFSALTEYKTLHPKLNEPKLLTSGKIRWWEDVIGSMKNTKKQTYSDAIICKYQTRW